mgnify:CR=1 FL=1
MAYPKRAAIARRRAVERNGSSDPGDVEQSAQTGNHTDGVTVADLIAKVHGASSVPEELRRALSRT